MKPQHLILAGLACSLLGLSVWADQPVVKPIDKPAIKATVIPLELLKSGHVAVMVKVNGKGPYRVIFDTGAPINLINNKLAKETGLLKNAPQSMLPLLGSIAEVQIKELDVGGAKSADQQAIVMDHPLVELMSTKLGPLYGIVGYPFFARYKTTIDYQALTLTMTPNGHKPANVLRSLESTAMQLLSASSQAPKVLSPAGQWGMTAHKAADDKEAGIRLTAILPGSASAEAGLKVGDRILTVDGRWTDSLNDLYDIASYLKPGVAIPVLIRRDGKEVEKQVTPRPGL